MGSDHRAEPAKLDAVNVAAMELGDTANAIALARDERAVVLRLPIMLKRWNAFRAAVREAGDVAAGRPPAPRGSPPPADHVRAPAENTLEHWEAALHAVTIRAGVAGFNVTYDVWRAPTAAKGGDDG